MAGPRDYRTFGETEAQLFRDLIAGSPSSSRPVSPSTSPSGIMAPRGVNMEEEARRSAEEAAAIRSGMGITESLRGPFSLEDSFVGQVARSMGANADDPESVATAVTTTNTDVPRANAGIQAYADMRPVEETLALGAGDQTLAALGRPDPLDMPDREGTTQGFTPDVPEPVLSIHTVQSGDLLTTIARRNNITLQALLQANPDITDPDSIAIGQEINIPSSDGNEVTETSVAATEGQPVSQQQEPSVEEAPVEVATEESTFSSVTNNLYEAFTVGGQEGTEAHVGLDSQNITLPAGIVADGLVYNGQTINAGQNTIPASSFDLSLLDTSGAYKTIGTGNNAVTIRRSDYNSDQDFSRAVIAEFENRARTAAGDNWDNIPQDAQEALVKVGWNLGTGWYSGSSANTLYDELSSDTPDINRINSSILRASTVRGGGASIGIAKARADAYNAARDAFNGAEITRIEADNTGTNTAFRYYDAEGNLVHTEQTSRAVGLYENRQTEISKNSSGAW